MLGWAQTSGCSYTSNPHYNLVSRGASERLCATDNAVASLGHTVTDDAALLCYDRQGWGGGYYGVGLPPVFGPKGAWPAGRAQPQGCYLDVSATFCIRVAVEV